MSRLAMIRLAYMAVSGVLLLLLAGRMASAHAQVAPQLAPRLDGAAFSRVLEVLFGRLGGEQGLLASTAASGLGAPLHLEAKDVRMTPQEAHQFLLPDSSSGADLANLAAALRQRPGARVLLRGQVDDAPFALRVESESVELHGFYFDQDHFDMLINRLQAVAPVASVKIQASGGPRLLVAFATEERAEPSDTYAGRELESEIEPAASAGQPPPQPAGRVIPEQGWYPDDPRTEWVEVPLRRADLDLRRRELMRVASPRGADGIGSSAVRPPATPEVREPLPQPSGDTRSAAPVRVERVEPVVRVEPVERVQRVERVERVEKPEKPEKVEKIEKAERPERPQKVERNERRERAERPERGSRGRRDD